MDKDAFDKLTERQKQCLRLVAAGKRSKTIGAALGISHLTVNQHVEAAKARLGSSSREEAAALLIAYEREGYPEGFTSVSPTVADTEFPSKIRASAIADDAPLPRSFDVVREPQAPYRVTGFGVDDLLRLPLRTPQRPRNDLTAYDTIFAIVKLMILLALGAVAVASIVDTMTKIGTNIR